MLPVPTQICRDIGGGLQKECGAQGFRLRCTNQTGHTEHRSALVTQTAIAKTNAPTRPSLKDRGGGGGIWGPTNPLTHIRKRFPRKK